jgi:hypothetical protein
MFICCQAWQGQVQCPGCQQVLELIFAQLVCHGGVGNFVQQLCEYRGRNIEQTVLTVPLRQAVEHGALQRLAHHIAEHGQQWLQYAPEVAGLGAELQGLGIQRVPLQCVVSQPVLQRLGAVGQVVVTRYRHAAGRYRLVVGRHDVTPGRVFFLRVVTESGSTPTCRIRRSRRRA